VDYVEGKGLEFRREEATPVRVEQPAPVSQ